MKPFDLGAALSKMFQAAADGRCPTCGKSTDHMPFRDELSAAEAEISGFCQPCQDDVFGF